MSSKTDSEIAREQKISRQAILNRRQQGWSQFEIEQGFRGRPRKARYKTRIAEELGMSVKEAAEKNGVTISEIYRRYHATKGGKAPKFTKAESTETAV